MNAHDGHDPACNYFKGEDCSCGSWNAEWLLKHEPYVAELRHAVDWLRTENGRLRNLFAANQPTPGQDVIEFGRYESQLPTNWQEMGTAERTAYVRGYEAGYGRAGEDEFEYRNEYGR